MKRILPIFYALIFIFFALISGAGVRYAIDRKTGQGPVMQKMSVSSQNDLTVTQDTALLQSKNQSPRLIDCNEDYDCFIVAAEKCAAANVTHTYALDLFGVKQTTVSRQSIQGLRSNECVFHILTDRIDLQFPPNVPKEIASAQQAEYDKLEGHEGVCTFAPRKLASLLRKWKEGTFDSGKISCGFASNGKTHCITQGSDWQQAAVQCTGSYFDYAL